MKTHSTPHQTAGTTNPKTALTKHGPCSTPAKTAFRAKWKLAIMLLCSLSLFPINAPAADAAVQLIQPGELGEKCTTGAAAEGGMTISPALLGFESSAYLIEPGIWGALRLTKAQGEEIKRIWAEIIVPAPNEPERSPAMGAFVKAMNTEVLDSDQIEARNTINGVAVAFSTEIAGVPAKEARAIFRTKLEAALPKERIEALDAVVSSETPNM
jgi:hypothetical protein